MSPMLDHSIYGLIFDTILSFADDDVLCTVRLTGREASKLADRVLFSHVLVDPIPSSLADRVQMFLDETDDQPVGGDGDTSDDDEDDGQQQQPLEESSDESGSESQSETESDDGGDDDDDSDDDEEESTFSSTSFSPIPSLFSSFSYESNNEAPPDSQIGPAHAPSSARPLQPLFVLRTPSGRCLPSLEEWYTRLPDPSDEDLEAAIPSGRVGHLCPVVDTERVNDLLSHVRVWDTVAKRDPMPMIATTMGATTRLKPRTIRLVVPPTPWLFAEVSMLAGSAGAGTVIYFAQLGHELTRPLDTDDMVRPLTSSLPDRIRTRNHRVHVSFDPKDKKLARALTNMPGLGGPRIRATKVEDYGRTKDPESVVFHFTPELGGEEEMLAEQEGPGEEAGAEGAAAEGEGPAEEAEDDEPDPMGAIAFTICTLASYPNTKFTFVGLESLPDHAIPALSSLVGSSSWSARSARLKSIMEDAVEGHGHSDTRRQDPRELDITLLTAQEYRDRITPAQFMLETAAPRPADGSPPQTFLDALGVVESLRRMQHAVLRKMRRNELQEEKERAGLKIKEKALKEARALEKEREEDREAGRVRRRASV